MGLFGAWFKTSAHPTDADATLVAQRKLEEGMAFEAQGQADAALSCYDDAIRLWPDLARAHFNRGNILLDRGDAAAALPSYVKAVQLRPDSAPAHLNLGAAYLQVGHVELSIAALRQAIRLQPNFTGAYVTLGLALGSDGQSGEAMDCFSRASEQDPHSVELHNEIGSALAELGWYKQAAVSYHNALAIDPNRLEVYYNLGVALGRLGQLDAALAAYERFLGAYADHYDAQINRATILRNIGRYEEGLAGFDRAIALRPNDAVAHFYKGVTLTMLNLNGLALDCYRHALTLQPDYADAHLSLGISLKAQGDIRSALVSVRRALALQPDYALAHNNLLFIQNYLAEQPQDELLADARCFGEVAQRQARPYHSWSNEPDAHRRLRVGLVSGDLGNHPVGYFLEGVLDALSTQAGDHLEFHAYSQRIGEDQTSQRLRACCASWVSTVGLTDEMMARRIRDDGIDILIDLAGHSANNRLSVFAWKPAPVQVSWLGYFATTGVVAMDYFIADSWTLPPEQEPYFTEQVWRLPETRLCFTPPRDAVQVNDLPALSRDYVTFGCFNNLSKMNDAVVALWARVLQAVPGSRLFLKYAQLAEASVRQLTCERFAVHGIAPERLIFEDYQARINYLSAYHRVDIALDPFPFPGGTTTVEALWMGVPVLTLTGERFLARQGVGLLMNAGLPEWVARDADDYVARAVAHASDLPALAALRARLRAQVLASPIFDAPRFARHFEHALRQMWVKWCAQVGAP